MEAIAQSPAEVASRRGPDESESGLFSIQSVLTLQRLIFAGCPLAEVLTNIAQLVEAQTEGMSCTIWLPDDEGNELHCVAAPGLPEFSAQVGTMAVGPKGGSCGTAVYRREPVYVTDILTDPIWDLYRDRLLPYGIRSVWSRPLFTSEGKALGTFSINYREARSPGAGDLQLIEDASHITGIAIERHIKEEALRHERDRLRLLLEITNSMTSKLDLRGLVEVLSTNLLRVTRADFCALLLPDLDRGELRLTTLYNPESQGAICDGAIIPIHGSVCGKAFRTGKSQHFNSLEEVRDDPESFGSEAGRVFYERFMAEGLKSGCDLPLIGRSGVRGVLGALKRSERAFEKEDVEFLEQVSRQVAIAVENGLDYEAAIKDRDKETKQRRYLEEEIRAECGEIVGESPALKAAFSLMAVVAPTDSSVLILGETGTGKELVARAIHKLGSRREKSFVKLNCAAIPLGLLESELFGHEKGAFTGAIAHKTGRFELADKGTLFLDEVGDIPLELQAKLLRVLQEQEFERLGSNRTHKVDVRLIAATHRDLPAMVRQGIFREDLYYRLKVFPIHVPALRQRTEDIPKLVWYFTALYGRRMNKQIDHIPAETMDALVRYGWPGNVRELQNFVERAVILSPQHALRAPIAELEPFHSLKESNSAMSGLAQVERDHILRALAASNWVIGGRNGAAERLGMKRTSLVYRMKKLRINRSNGFPRDCALANNTAQVVAGVPAHAAKMVEFPKNSTIVLVHAAWADGYCWSNIVPPLERRGLEVICAPIPLTSLTGDATALSVALERTSGPVVLVGHAYSGAVIAAVREERVKSLVYVAALAPDEGETVAKVFYRDTQSPEAPKMVPDSHGLVWMPGDAFHRALAQKASPDQAKTAASVQRPISVQCIQEPAPTPLWRSKPSWYLVAEEDRMINPKTQHFMADRMGATVRSHRVDHTPMYSQPAVVTEVILEAARKTLSQ